MAHKYVETAILLPIHRWILQLHQTNSCQNLHPIQFQLLSMISRDLVLTSKGTQLSPSQILKVVMVINARTSSDSNFLESFPHKYGAGLPKIIDVLGNPASKVKLSQGVYSFMVASYEYC